MNKIPLTQELTQLHAGMCSALADPYRIMIIYTLAERPQNVSSLVDKIGISQPTTSRNLKILRQTGLVKAVRRGAYVEYSLVDHRIITALDLLRSVLRDRVNYRAELIKAVD